MVPPTSPTQNTLVDEQPSTQAPTPESFVAELAGMALRHRAVRHPYLRALREGTLPDLRWALVAGVAACWAAARVMRGRLPSVLLTALIALPLCLAFHALVVVEIPTVWFFLPAFAVAAWIGSWRHGRLERVAAPTLGLATVGVALALVPRAVEAGLFERVEEPAPEFGLIDAESGAAVEPAALKGKLVLLDFFGTWCGPCIAALPEIERVHATFAGDPRVQVAAVCTNALGDTAEAALAFGKQHALPYPVWFDAEGRAHTAFGFTGVPSLVLLDASGRVRLRHEGYNPSEDLAGNLERIMTELLDAGPR